ncbi:MAG: transporter [Rubrobacteraceae bacterium]|nr:transporter [Rubrobacteraceae bacterium]
MRGRPVLLILLAVAVFFGMSGEGFDRLWEAHLLKEIGLPPLAGMEPVVWFGLINAGTLVLDYLATEILGYSLDVSNVAVAARLLFVLNALTVVGVLAFALAGGPVVGATGTLASIRAALANAAIVLSPALLLYGRAVRHGGVDPSLDARNDTGKSNYGY